MTPEIPQVGGYLGLGVLVSLPVFFGGVFHFYDLAQIGTEPQNEIQDQGTLVGKPSIPPPLAVLTFPSWQCGVWEGNGGG